APFQTTLGHFVFIHLYPHATRDLRDKADRHAAVVLALRHIVDPAADATTRDQNLSGVIPPQCRSAPNRFGWEGAVRGASETAIRAVRSFVVGDDLCYFVSIGENWTPAMVVIYASTFPYDPETELKNFQRKQAKYEAAYRRTREPLALFEAMLHVQAARQTPPDWLAEAVGDIIMRSRTNKRGRPNKTAKRFRERMRHVRRYQRVRDLRRQGQTKDGALDLAVAALEATGEPAVRSTIEDSY